jgi:hypothetical protein
VYVLLIYAYAHIINTSIILLLHHVNSLSLFDYAINNTINNITNTNNIHQHHHNNNICYCTTGSAGVYRERKRSLLEGGIRVPTVVQWLGHIPSHSQSDIWGSHVDLLPTILHAAGISIPSGKELNAMLCCVFLEED